jgi:outer membrane receptor protein involved in Fe transport
LKKFVPILFLLEFFVGYSVSTGKPDPLQEYPEQTSDSLQKGIVSDTVQKIAEKKFIEEDKFKKEVWNHFSNQDEILFDDIDDSFVKDLGDILRMRGLLNVVEVGPPGQLETGFWGGNRDFRIFIDGILYEQQSLNLPQKGVLDLNSIPVENIEKIEIFPSGMANLWARGSGLGGINIITKDYKGSEPYSRVMADRGPYGYHRTQVELGRGVTSRGKIYLTGGFKKSDGYLTNSDYDGMSFSEKTTFSLKKNLNLRVSAYQYETKMGIPLFPSVNIEDTRKKEDNWGIASSLLFEQNQNSLLRLEFRYDKQEQKLRSTSFGFGIEKVNRLFSLKATQTFKGGKRHNLKIEAYADREKFEAENFDHVAYGTYLSFSDFVNINEKINLLLFSKIENKDKFKVNFSGLAGISYQIAPEVNLFSTFGRFVNYPQAMDLYWNPFSLDLNDTMVNYMEEGNPNLKSEKSTIFDLGAGFRKKIFRINCLLFKSRVNDFIYWDNIDTSIAYGYFKPINTKADIWGMNLNSSLLFFKRFKSFISYCFKESKDLNKKLFFPQSPKHSFFGYLQYENEFLKREIGLKFRLEANILSERFLDEYEKDKEPEVAILNGKITIRFLDFHFYYVVENITDRVYRLTRDYPMPERSYYWGFYWEFFD